MYWEKKTDVKYHLIRDVLTQNWRILPHRQFEKFLFLKIDFQSVFATSTNKKSTQIFSLRDKTKWNVRNHQQKQNSI